jgi:FkbM family methyltransferase
MQTIARFHFTLFPGGGLVNMPGGPQMLIPGNKHFIGYLLGNHEEHISQVICDELRAGDVCIDVGANIGYFALKMAKAVGAKGRVYCYEPDADNYAALQRNLDLARRATGCEMQSKMVAVSSESSSVRLVRGEECTGHHVCPLEDSASGEGIVRAVSLDDEFRSSGDRIALAKVDVEGHELSVLAGARSLLARRAVSSWILEIWPGEQAVEIGKVLRNAGYTVRVWLDEGWVEIPLENLPYRTDLLATVAA